MPTFRIPLNVSNGARVQVRVSLNRSTILSRRRAQQTIPQPVIVEAIIDTGAERSCIDPTVATRAVLPLLDLDLARRLGRRHPRFPHSVAQR